MLAGIHGALSQCSGGAVFTVACDMPQLNPALIRFLAAQYRGVDLVMPKSDGGYEPLHAIYGGGCLPVVEELLQKGEQRVISLLPKVRVREVAAAEVGRFDPEFCSFANINTPEDYYRLRNGRAQDGDAQPCRCCR